MSRNTPFPSPKLDKYCHLWYSTSLADRIGSFANNKCKVKGGIGMKKNVSFLKSFSIIFLGTIGAGVIINATKGGIFMGPYVLITAVLSSVASGLLCIKQYHKQMTTVKVKVNQTNLQTKSI